MAGGGVPGDAVQLDAAHGLHGVLGVAEPADGADEADFDGLDAQVEARQQDGGRDVAGGQHVCHVLHGGQEDGVSRLLPM